MKKFAGVYSTVVSLACFGAAGFLVGAGLTMIAAASVLAVGLLLAVVSIRFVKNAAFARNALVAHSEAFEGGDYRSQIPVKRAGVFADALGRVNRASSKMARSMTATQVEMEQVQRNRANLDQLGETLARDADAAGAHLGLLVETMDGVSSQIEQTSENAQHAMRLARDARDKATEGDQLMSQMVISMQESDEAARSISRIIRVIDDIAFQTNLLALNAAVEAARAGNHGKGFAVVAEEVRNLAARSGTAAKETSELIERSLSKAETATNLATETAGALSGIVLANTQFSDLVGEIAAAAEEEADGLRTMNGALSHLEGSLNSTRATASQIGGGYRLNSSYAPAISNSAKSEADDSTRGIMELGNEADMKDEVGDPSDYISLDDGDDTFGF